MSGTPAGKTPGMLGTAVSDTPLNLQNVDPAAIRRAAAGLPADLLNTLQQVAGQHTPYQAFQVHTDTQTHTHTHTHTQTDRHTQTYIRTAYTIPGLPGTHTDRHRQTHTHTCLLYTSDAADE